MKLGKLARLAVVALSLGLSLSASACSRDHIEAIKAMNEGNSLMKVSADSAIAKYKEAAQLDPSNHMILWQLAKAQRKKQDWQGMASTLSQAIGKAPEFANYSYYRGYALIRSAQEDKHNRDLYDESIAPLEKCVETDSNLAECHHWLGEAYHWTDKPELALQHFTKAIELNPAVGYFYPEPAKLYLALRLPASAQQLLEEGLKVVPKTEDNADAIFAMHVALAGAYQANDQRAKMLPILEAAKKLGGKKHPEADFYLGAAYAKQEPPNATKAIQFLDRFRKRGCKGVRAELYRAQCVQADTFVQLLGGVEN